VVLGDKLIELRGSRLNSRIVCCEDNDGRPAAGSRVIGRRRTLEVVSAEVDMRELLACLVSRIKDNSS
jgi:hypothetical protein